MTTRLEQLSPQSLLGLHAEVSAELRRRKICRSGNNPVADYAEGLVAKALGLTLATGSTKGFDATDSQGCRYEVKARRLAPSVKSGALSPIRDIQRRHFDFLVVVVFNEDYTVRRAVQIPHEPVLLVAKFRQHVNGHIVEIRDLWEAPGSLDITARLLLAV